MFNIFSSASGEPPSISKTDINNIDDPMSNYDEIGENGKTTSAKDPLDNEKLEIVSSSNAKDGKKRPTLKIGIVLPKQIFQQRRYQVFI